LATIAISPLQKLKIMENAGINIPKFMAISSLLTGCEETILKGTGMTEQYASQLEEGVGKMNVAQFMQAAAEAIHATTESGQHAAMEELFNHYKFGAICKNIIQMWYTGTWFALPAQWQVLYGTGAATQQSITISTESYQQGLIWDIIDAHPPGAKQPGFGSWGFDPSRTKSTSNKKQTENK
jgi:hypothetical protein